MKASIKKAIKNNSMLGPAYDALRRLYVRLRLGKQRLKQKIYGPQMLRDIHSALVNHGVEYYAEYGTLLGFARNGRFIKHDDDIDIAVFADNVAPADLLSYLKKRGFSFFRALVYEGNVFVMVMQRHGVHLDISFHFREGGRQWTQFCITGPKEINGEIRQVKLANRQFRSPVNLCTEIKVYGTPFRIPANYDRILSETYGEEWRVPVANWARPKDHPTQKLIQTMPEVVTQVDEAYVMTNAKERVLCG